MLALPSIFLAALATIPVGFLWYSPAFFANPWIELNAISAKKMKNGPGVMPFLFTLLTSLVLACLMGLLIKYLNIRTVSDAWRIGTLLWFGFDFMPSVTRALFSKKPLALVLIDTGHQAANILLVCWILMLSK